MKQKILLADESLTVQKVVSLTFDKSRFQLTIAKSRPELIKSVIEHIPDLILVSDTFHDVQWQSFPKEVEAWLGRDHSLPKLVLVTGQELVDAKHYDAVLRKPFSPQSLKDLVREATSGAAETGHEAMGETGEVDEDDRPTEFITIEKKRSTSRNASASPSGSPPVSHEDQMERHFNRAFADEGELVEQTLNMRPENRNDTRNVPPARPIRTETHNDLATKNRWAEDDAVSPLWEVKKVNSFDTVQNEKVMDAADSMAYKAAIENRVHQELNSQDLEAVVEKVLGKMMPPIIERVVQERLDQLLKDQETSI